MIRTALTATVLAVAASAASADIVVSFVENTVTNTVTVTATGSLQTAPLGTPATGNYGFGSLLVPAGGYVSLGPSPSMADHWYLGNVALPYGGGGFTTGTFIGPDVFGIYDNGLVDQLRMPAGYVSGTQITAASVFSGSFASRGITPTTVVVTLPGDQTVTLNFSSIPTPGAAAALGLGGLAMLRRRR